MSDFSVVWQCRKQDDIWQDYGAEANAAMEHAFQEGNMKNLTIRVPRAKFRKFDTDPFVELKIDFDKMLQIGEIARPIRRVAILAPDNFYPGSRFVA